MLSITCFTVWKYVRLSDSQASMLSAWLEIEDSRVSVAISVILFLDTDAAMLTRASTVMTTTGMMYIRSLVLIFLFFFLAEALTDGVSSILLILLSPVFV